MPKVDGPRAGDQVATSTLPRVLTHQLRVLRALDGVPALTRVRICQRAGFSPTSGTITNALNGVRPGSSTQPDGRPGLVELGLVRRIELDVDGVSEVCFQMTELGKQVLAAQAGELKPLPDKLRHTNRRYKGGADGNVPSAEAENAVED